MKKEAIGGAVGLIENGNELAALDYLDVLRTVLAVSWATRTFPAQERKARCARVVGFDTSPCREKQAGTLAIHLEKHEFNKSY